VDLQRIRIGGPDRVDAGDGVGTAVIVAVDGRDRMERLPRGQVCDLGVATQEPVEQRGAGAPEPGDREPYRQRPRAHLRMGGEQRVGSTPFVDEGGELFVE
jgi:hypothetical protein